MVNQLCCCKPSIDNLELAVLLPSVDHHLHGWISAGESSASTPPHLKAGIYYHLRATPPRHASALPLIKMSSYFSSFTSSNSISNVLGSRLNSLRRAITLGDEADDPDNEDCSHISNALRAYYTEKGRPFPPWLPPDPKAPAAAVPRVVATTQLSGGGHGQAPATVSGGRGGGLGDLWGDSGAAQPPLAQTASLRRARGAATAPPLTSMHSAPPGPVPSPTPPPAHGQSYSPGPPGPGLHPAGARPLPSQRAGSYQPSARPAQDRAGSAQERLRARLQGGRSPSPSLDPSVRKPVGGPGRNW